MADQAIHESLPTCVWGEGMSSEEMIIDLHLCVKLLNKALAEQHPNDKDLKKKVAMVNIMTMALINQFNLWDKIDVD